MGRDAGHIALNAGIGAGAEEILIPEEDLGLEIAYAQKEITIEPVTNEAKILLNLHPNDTQVVIVRSLVYLEDTRCFEYTESVHRLDKFRFVDFARRKKI